MIDGVIWSPESENDLSLILNYLLLKWGNEVAQSFLKTLEQHIKNISERPKLHPIIFKTRNFRKCVLTKHNSLIYSQIGGNIYILRVFDNRQDPSKLKFNR